jgi:hypothetical protein
MTDFIITRPSRGTDTLHVDGCKNVHGRATRQTVREAAMVWSPTLWRGVDGACITPGLEAVACAQWDIAREDWEAERDAEKAATDARHYAEWLKQRANSLEYVHAFLPLRDALRTYYPEAKVSADVRTEDWKMHPRFDLAPRAGLAFPVTHNRTTGRLERIDISYVRILTSADAYRIGDALRLIENFVVVPF